MEEHQIGEYKYDMQVPDFNSVVGEKRKQHGRNDYLGVDDIKNNEYFQSMDWYEIDYDLMYVPE